MREFRVGDCVLFLSKSDHEARQVLATVTAVVPENKHKGKYAQVIVRLRSTGEKVAFAPNISEDYVKVLPRDTKTITEALLYLSAQNVEM